MHACAMACVSRLFLSTTLVTISYIIHKLHIISFHNKSNHSLGYNISTSFGKFPAAQCDVQFTTLEDRKQRNMDILEARDRSFSVMFTFIKIKDIEDI